MSEAFVSVLTHEVQYAALAFMALVYTVRIIWILKFTAPAESTPARGSHSAGISHAMMNIAMPWQLESYRRKPLRYVEFVVFHVAVAVAIAASIIRPETDITLGAHSSLWNDYPIIGLVCAGICAAAVVAGVLRLIRRISRPEMRIISSPDDYFSMILLNCWLAAGVFGLQAAAPVWATVAFFVLTTFFLVYVPFSKISHYLYYPFNKWYIGKHLGHRGVYPKGMAVVGGIDDGTDCATAVVQEESKANA